MHLNEKKRKTLVFIRHGKSSWKYSVDDLVRPLKKRGISDIGLIANEFSKLKIKSDLVVSSPAKRALDTCNTLMKILDISDNFYQVVFLFGHNNAFTNLINHLGNLRIDNLPTSGLVVIRFDVSDWSDICNGITLSKLFPKDFK